MWITVFKAGTHKNNAGVEQTYTEGDLSNIANTYNNQSADNRHTAPLIPGDHDKVEFADGTPIIKPAMGWVEQLKVEGMNLLAKIDPTPKFTEAVKGKYYRGLSISIKPSNLLDHIALLGSVNPALKGLPSLDSSFTMNINDIANVESYEFAEPEPTPPQQKIEEDINPKTNTIGETMSVMTLDTAKLIEWVKTEFGDETATKIQAKIGDFKAEPEEPKVEDNPPAPPTPPADDSFSEAQKAEAIKQNNRIQELESKLRLSEYNEFVGTTHIPVGLKAVAINSLEIANNSESSNFSVKDESGKDASPVGVLKSLLKAWPSAVDLGEDPNVTASNFAEQQTVNEAIGDAAKKFNESRK